MDAVLIFDPSGRTIVEYKLRDYPASKVVAALSALGCQELSSSQLLYHRAAFGARVAVVFGSAQSPLQIENFVDNFVKVVEQYLDQKPSLTALDANAATILTLLDLMLDDGYPAITEPSLVCAMVPIRGPSIEVEYEGTRRQGLQYTNEEIFIDVVERLTLEVAPKKRSSKATSIYANTPKPVRCTVAGEINVLSRLQGLAPRLSIDLNIDNKAQIYLHPCVDALQWDRQRLLIFTPPDHRSTVATYTLDSDHTGMVSAELHLNMGVDKSEFEVHVRVSMDTIVKSIDNLVVSIVAPGAKSIKENRMTAGELTANLKLPHRFDWTFGPSTPAGWEATLRGTAVGGQDPSFVSVGYSLMGKVPSKTSVKSVQVPLNGTKKPYKGVRYRTFVENYTVRA